MKIRGFHLSAVKPGPNSPYVIQLYLRNGVKIIELRPRHGIWRPFIFGIPADERFFVRPILDYGPRNIMPDATLLKQYNEELSADNAFWLLSAHNEALPTHSYFITCQNLPSKIIFGQPGEEYLRVFIDGGR